MRSVAYITSDSKGFSLLAQSAREQFHVCHVETRSAACRAVSSGLFDAIFFDPVLYCANPKHLLVHLTSIPHRPPLFVVSREPWGLFARFIRELGLSEYYVLPGDINRLIFEVERTRGSGPLDHTSSVAVSEKPPMLDGPAARFFLGGGPEAVKLLWAVFRLRGTCAPVLVLGESGSGKELISRMVHENSPVRDGPFVPVNASCFTESIGESQLFGTVKGAYTGAESSAGYFESADGGTLFLDEIAELGSAFQAKLLRVVEDGMINRVGSTKRRHVSVRLICASNRSLQDMVKQGLFRSDLFYRLDVLRLHVPALRTRKEDIPLLVTYRLSKLNKQLSHSALVRLQSYTWPGNVRELFHCLDRAAGMAPSDVIYPEHLDF